MKFAVFLVATLGGTTRQILFPFPFPYGIEWKRKRETPQVLFFKINEWVGEAIPPEPPSLARPTWRATVVEWGVASILLVGQSEP